MKQIGLWVKNPANLPYVVYAAVSLVILGPMLLPGYILTLDMVFTPHIKYVLTFDNLLLYHWFLNFINMVVPSQVIQKVILFVILFLSGLGMHRLVQGSLPSTKSSTMQWGAYAAGLFYVINPFTYSRFMAGQYLVLLGYALMPWLVAALIRFVRNPQVRSGFFVFGWLFAISLVSIHYVGFALMVLATVVIGGLVVYRGQLSRLKSLVLGVVGMILGLVVASGYWLVPLINGGSKQAQLIEQFDLRHLLSFRTATDPVVGQMVNTIGLHGFWGDREGWYLLPQNVLPWWHVAFALIFGVMACGVYYCGRRQRLRIAFFVAVLLVGWVLAQGVIGSPVAGVNKWIYAHVPLFAGYREPGKFIGLVALAEAYLFGLGVAAIMHKASNKRGVWRSLLPGLLLALPLLYTPTMVGGFAGQLKPVDYPPDWYAINRELNQEHSEGSVLFLPWHQYMYFDFANRLIANPAQRFFDRNTVQGDNAEIGLIERQSSSTQSIYIERFILSEKDGRKDLGSRLNMLGTEYVVLAKEADYKDYRWLDGQEGLKRVGESKTLVWYKNRHYVAQRGGQ